MLPPRTALVICISRAKNGKHKTRPGDLVLGRQLKGEFHHQANLTEADVLEIRSLRPEVRLIDLAKRFGVSKTIISDAAVGKTGTHQPGAFPRGEAKPGPRPKVPAA